MDQPPEETCLLDHGEHSGVLVDALARLDAQLALLHLLAKQRIGALRVVDDPDGCRSATHHMSSRLSRRTPCMGSSPPSNTGRKNHSGPRSFLYYDGRYTALRCTGIGGYLRLSITTISYGHFFPGTHCPPTIGVVQTFLTGTVVHWLGGVPSHWIGPTIVLILVLRTASIIEAADSGFCARFKDVDRDLEQGMAETEACGHCFLATSSYACKFASRFHP